MAERLQGGGFTEQGVLVIGGQFQAALEGKQGRFRIFRAQVADGQAEVRVVMFRVQRAGVMESFGRIVPGTQAFQADRQVEPPGGVLRFHLHQGTVAAGGLIEVAEFELDMAHRTVNLRRGVAFGDGSLQVLQSLVALSRQVQGDGTGQVGGSSGGGYGRRRGF